MDFNLLFPDNREQGENSLRQGQLVMLRMLKIFDYLCRKHSINYFLVGGGLLGAIRHKGFIPWDDDLDVGMTRDNYEKFLEFAVAELPEDVFFQNPDTDIYYSQQNNVEARLRDKYSSYVHQKSKNNKWHEGLQVDIFVYDRAYLPSKLYIILQNAILKRLNHKQKRASVLKFVSKYHPFPLVYASSYLQAFGSMKNNVIYIKEDEVQTLIRTEFEDMTVFIPVGWKNYLHRQFGDFMELPPLEKRKPPHNVSLAPFIPCNHREILHWKNRKYAGTS